MLSSGREAGEATFAPTIGFAADVAVRDGVVVANALFASGLRNAWKSDIFPAPPPLSVVFSFLAVGRFTTVSIIGVSNSPSSSSSDDDDERNVGVIEEKGTTKSFLLLLSLKLASKASSNASSSSSSFTSSVVNSISESVTSSSETSTFLRIKALLLLCCTTISSSESSSSKSSSSFPLFLSFREGGDLDDAFILVRIFIFFMKKREVFPLWH
jgi:hypothetical protein